ncbi:hypothetical protein [Micromonospora sp. URMC 103]|uniref:hypothetical protein n=1 Tax=Micromonospora sp. URMC 103 TaxID=3423406 RepID=UPI003F1D553D
MSGRKLGRLSGSLLLLAAAATIGLHAGSHDSGIEGEFHNADIIWTFGADRSTVDYQAADIIWTVVGERPATDNGL